MVLFALERRCPRFPTFNLAIHIQLLTIRKENYLSDSNVPFSARGASSPQGQCEASIQVVISEGVSLNVEMLPCAYPTKSRRVVDICCTSIITLVKRLIKYFLIKRFSLSHLSDNHFVYETVSQRSPRGGGLLYLKCVKVQSELTDAGADGLEGVGVGGGGGGGARVPWVPDVSVIPCHNLI